MVYKFVRIDLHVIIYKRGMNKTGKTVIKRVSNYLIKYIDT